ncbi:hypothetical protein AMECASPLE_004880 [Ameca splendens]|uniref:Uncharacterized protein n=1 Tax=Ameca splendens TaxID=208324 RepID=A0ABV0YM71_9TELE
MNVYVCKKSTITAKLLPCNASWISLKLFKKKKKKKIIPPRVIKSQKSENVDCSSRRMVTAFPLTASACLSQSLSSPNWSEADGTKATHLFPASHASVVCVK